MPVTETRCALLLVGAGVEELLDQPQLAVAADERRLEALRLERPARPGDDAQRPPERRQARPCPSARASPRPRRRSPARSRAASPRRRDRAGLGGRLDPRRGVDEVAGDHALALGAERDRGLAGEHAGAGAKLAAPDLVAERGHGGDQVERGPHGALGVVLGATGVPQTAITASPMNFSTVPP